MGEVLEFIAAIVAIVSWPMTVIAVMVILRNEIRKRGENDE